MLVVFLLGHVDVVAKFDELWERIVGTKISRLHLEWLLLSNADLVDDDAQRADKTVLPADHKRDLLSR